MKLLKSLVFPGLIFLGVTSISIISWNRVEAQTQISSSDCNIQSIGDGVTISGITLVCSPPDIRGAANSPLRVEAKVNNLYRGNNRFTLEVANKSSQHIVHFGVSDLTLVDDLGNVYSRDPFQMEFGLSYEIPPSSKVRISYALRTPISRSARRVQMTLNGVSGQPLSSGFRFFAPPVRWDAQLDSQSGPIILGPQADPWGDFPRW